MTEEIKQEEKLEEKEEEKKEKKVEQKKKKETASVNVKDASISLKHSVALCRFIKGKRIEFTIKELEQVLRKKIAIPMKGEIAHRKGIERGRYPEKATRYFIKILKSLNANSTNSEIEEPYIFFAKANKASRPYRRWGSRKFKRTHIIIMSRSKRK